MLPEFEEFPKIARLSRECVISEKLDGTNGLIEFRASSAICDIEMLNAPIVTIDNAPHYMLIGSRTKWITPEEDNYGFARWAYEHKDELASLGVGRHFGEWWGQGIQRKYGLTEKRFSLFNTSKWYDSSVRPACCHCVPILAEGIFHGSLVDGALNSIRAGGSAAAPGFMNAEGIIIYHTAARLYFKKTLIKDEEWKGK